jgi:hypothetical protein
MSIAHAKRRSDLLPAATADGSTHIDTHDYAVLDEDKIGIRARFPGRRVAGMENPALCRPS